MLVIREHSIIGRATARRAGVKSRFFNAANETVSVEELVIEHFSAPERGGWRGVHCENGLWTTLATLLFADVIMDDRAVPDAFHGPFATAPLDFGTDAFYARRRPAIDARLALMERGAESSTHESALTIVSPTMSEQSSSSSSTMADSSEAETVAAAAIAAIHALLERIFATYAGRRISGVDWEAYTLADLKAIVTAVGGAALAVIARRLVMDGASWSGGLPDLLLLRQSGSGTGAGAFETDGAHTAMLVEVKSERDRLSDQQRAWLMCLHAHRVPVLVCRVRENAAHVKREDDE
jgi:Fanconi-associated nuclease 1